MNSDSDDGVEIEEDEEGEEVKEVAKDAVVKPEEAPPAWPEGAVVKVEEAPPAWPEGVVVKKVNGIEVIEESDEN